MSSIVQPHRPRSAAPSRYPGHRHHHSTPPPPPPTTPRPLQRTANPPSHHPHSHAHHHRHQHHPVTRGAMSGFLSREAENALLGDAADAQRLFDAQQQQQEASAFGAAMDDPRAPTPLLDDEHALWAHAHTSPTGLEYFHPFPVPPPAAFMPGATFASAAPPHFDHPGLGSPGFPPAPSAMAREGSGLAAGSGPAYSTASSPELLQGAFSAASSPELVHGALPPGQRPFPPALPTLGSSTDLASAFTASRRPSGISEAAAAAAAASAYTPAVPGAVAPSAAGSSSAPSRSSTPHPPAGPADLASYGTLNADARTWTCAYPGCASRALFARPCDLRKHFRRHSKHFFCRHEGCPQALQGGFSSKKDRARHEAKHNPGVECEWEGCERVFSRVDNMRNHMQRSKFLRLGGATTRPVRGGDRRQSG